MKRQIYTLNRRGKGSLNDLVAEELYLWVDTSLTPFDLQETLTNGNITTIPIVIVDSLINATKIFQSTSNGSSITETDGESTTKTYGYNLLNGFFGYNGVSSFSIVASTKPNTVNTEFEVPDDGEKLLSNTSVSYSTTETLTGGTWIDDKPIYRKVFTNVESVGYVLSINIPNVENFIPGQTQTQRIDDVVNESYIESTYDLGTGELDMDFANVETASYNVVVEYTKITP